MSKKDKKKYTYDYLDIVLSESEEYTKYPDPEDSWDAGDRKYALHGVSVYYRSFTSYEKFSHYEQPIAKVGDVVYVPVETYDTGSTFGREDNRHGADEVFKTREEAEEFIKDNPGTVGYFDSHIDWEIYECVVQDKNVK